MVGVVGSSPIVPTRIQAKGDSFWRTPFCFSGKASRAVPLSDRNIVDSGFLVGGFRFHNDWPQAVITAAYGNIRLVNPVAVIKQFFSGTVRQCKCILINLSMLHHKSRRVWHNPPKTCPVFIIGQGPRPVMPYSCASSVSSVVFRMVILTFLSWFPRVF